MKYKNHFKEHFGIYMNVVIIAIVFGGIGTYFVYQQIRTNTFRTVCSALKGKTLTLENVKKLKGKVYWVATKDMGLTGGVEPVQQYHINQYLDYLKGTALPSTSSHIVSTISDAITISDSGLDNVWRCVIKADKKGMIISSGSYFQTD
jgi:hypothetical protein